MVRNKEKEETTQSNDTKMPDVLKERLTKRDVSKRNMNKALKDNQIIKNNAEIPSGSKTTSSDVKKALKRRKMKSEDDLDCDDLLAEFQAEILLNEEQEPSSPPSHSPLMSPISEPIGTFDNNFGLRDFGIEIYSFPLPEAELGRFMVHDTYEWSSTVPGAKMRVREALHNRNLTTADHPPEMLSRFNMIWNEFKRYPKKDRKMHLLVAKQLVDLIRCSIGPNFLPEANVLSRLLHDIAIPNYADESRLDEQIFLLLQSFLTSSPPCSVTLRYYWLQVLSKSNCDYFGKEIVQKTARKNDPSSGTINDLNSRAQSFRKLVLQAFGATNVSSDPKSKDPPLPSPTLQSLLVDILEADLWSCQLMGAKEKYSKTENLDYHSALKCIPLAYLLFYDPEKRMCDFNTEAKKVLNAFARLIENEEDPCARETAARMLALSLEGVYWYGANVFKHHELLIDGIPKSLRVDVQMVGRKLDGLTKSQVQELLPLKWIQSCIYARE
ncbi:unnamed protein product, partial [Mesorhabditis belari]|uniref:Uncharacterized protein n=1 Tax=Mesorhabditis belari TaxID=2138241 RepID=A0AAF3ESG7_9BILA